jgi:hypothetical protein
MVINKKAFLVDYQDVLKVFDKVCNGNLTEENLELYLSAIHKLTASQTTAKAR